MDGLLGQAVLGIVTGILTTAVLWASKAVWDAKLEPLLQKARYEGIVVAGKWHGEAKGDDGSRTEATLYLNQNAHDISGTFAIDHAGHGWISERRFGPEGVFEGETTLRVGVAA